MKSLFTVCLILIAFAGVNAQSLSIPYGNNAQAGKYKSINGINVYYETYGSGKPLILLHGNGGSIRGHAKRIEYLKDHFQVIAIDSRAHGKSNYPVDKPLKYEDMALDVKVLMDSLAIDSALVWGQSDGGILALLLAIHYPKKVSRIAAFGANVFPGEEAIFSELEKMVVDSLKLSGNPKIKQLFSLLAYQPNITEKELETIKCPVLLMSGDRDAIRLEHTLQMFYAIPNSNLFVMPGASHFGAYQKPELFNTVLMDFFTKPFSKLSTVEIMTQPGK